MQDKKLTGRQMQILQYIEQAITQNGYPPSVREIGLAVGLSSSASVYAQLSQLEKKGYIRRDPTKQRAIEILSDQKQKVKTISVPIVGDVTAGEPILAVENIEGYVSISEDFFQAENLFLLRIKGDSMKDAGILNGDLVIVRKQSAADNGDIVVALLDEDATVKRFYREENQIRLQPENPAYAPIVVDQDVRILGKVVGVLRRY
ncbi:MAG: transcriptional repressor LexA [bacterium]|jgi:repressor LexA